MRKALRIIAVYAGIISVISTIILGSIYLEDILVYIKSTKDKLTNKAKDKKNTCNANVNKRFEKAF